MAVYTAFDMVRDCAANKREGWQHFISHYLLAAGAFMDRYRAGVWPEGAGRAEAYRELLKDLQRADNRFFSSLQPAQGRIFLTSLRDYLLDRFAPEQPDTASVLMDAIMAGLTELTVVEKQFFWLETMNYSDAETGAMMFADPATVARARQKGNDLLRGHLDTWSAGMLARNAVTLRHDVRKLHSEECIDPRLYCDAIDGRITWNTKADMEYHLAGCWFCIDHFCRVRDTDWTLAGKARGLLPETEVVELLEFLGFERPKKTLWQKALGA